MKYSIKLCSILICLALFAGMIPAFASDAAQGSSTIEVVPFSSIYEDDELNQFFMDNNGPSVISELGQELINMENIISAEHAEEMMMGEATVTAQNIAALNEKYGLTNADATSLYAENGTVLVKRDLDTYEVSNIWYITYFPSNAGFEIKVANIGLLDPLDRIHGTVTLYRLNGSGWVSSTTHSFDKSSVRNGSVDNWLVGRAYVKEKFVATYTVVEDGIAQTFTSADNGEFSRYLFAGGSYSSISAAGGERHHLVSSSALTSYAFSTSAAGCIRMIQSEHYLTPNWGSSSAASIFMAKERAFLKLGDYEGLLQLELDSLAAIPDPDGKTSNLKLKYGQDNALALCLVSYYTLFDIPLPG